MALARTTHLCVIAHQDDIEINAYPAVAECYGKAGKFFTGVTVTNGAGSPRAGKYAAMTDAQMMDVRREEQRAAARLGRYNLQLQLGHPSADVKKSGHAGVAADLKAIFTACRPSVVYLHQPADTAYRSSHAIFVREGATRAYDGGQVPLVFRPRPLSVRAFDAGHAMVDAELIAGTDVEPLFERWLSVPTIAYLHVHYAVRGCFAARVERPA